MLFFFLNYYLSLYYVVKHKRLGGYQIITSRQRSCGKVMLSLMSVCLSVHRRQGPHVAITYDVLDIIVQLPPPIPWASDLGPPKTSDLDPPSPSPLLLVTSSGHHWRPVQTCSFGNTPPPKQHLVVATCMVYKRWYISCWNAFLCSSKDLNGNLFGWSVIKDTYVINFKLRIPHFASQFETRNSLGNDKAVWERFLRSILCSLLPQ